MGVTSSDVGLADVFFVLRWRRGAAGEADSWDSVFLSVGLLAACVKGNTYMETIVSSWRRTHHSAPADTRIG